MSFANTNRNSSPAGATPSRPNSARHSATSAHAVPPPSAHAGNNAITVRASSSFSTRAATAPAPSARPRRVTNGWPEPLGNYFPSPIPMSLSRCLTSFPYSHWRTREPSTTSFFERFRRPCSPLPPTRIDSAHELGFLAVLHTWNQQTGSEPSLMMPGIIISFVFSEQTMLIVCTAPV